MKVTDEMVDRFVDCWPGMPVVVRRAYRDEVYIAELSKAVSAFIDELDEIANKVRASA